MDRETFEDRMSLFFAAITRARVYGAFGKISTAFQKIFGRRLEDIIEDAVCEKDLQCRVRYDKRPDGFEAYYFETLNRETGEWELLRGYAMEDDKISYEALAEARDLLSAGYRISFV